MRRMTAVTRIQRQRYARLQMNFLLRYLFSLIYTSNLSADPCMLCATCAPLMNDFNKLFVTEYLFPLWMREETDRIMSGVLSDLYCVLYQVYIGSCVLGMSLHS